MNDYTVTSDVVRDSLLTLWTNVAGFLPRLIAAIVVFLIGWLIAVLLGKAIWHVVKFIQLDKGLESVGFKKVWDRSGHGLDSAMFFYELVKWFFIVVFLMAATNILGLIEVTEFLRSVVYYLPNVFIAAIVLVIGVLVARFLEGLVRGSVRAAELHSANFLGMLVRYAVIVFSFLIALEQLQVGSDIIRIAVTGVIVAAALAFGLAFGLGGRDHAEQWLSHWRKNIQD